MIRKVKFNNFYSFKGEQEINFLAKKKRTFDYYNSKSGDQITKVATFIGGNASGKTNAMRLFSFFSYFICHNPNRIDNNFYNPYIAYKKFFNNNKPSDFSIEYEKDDFIYQYEFSIEKDFIRKEKLLRKKIDSKSEKMDEIFSRNFNNFKLNKDNYFDKGFPVEALEKNIPGHISAIAYIKNNYNVEIIVGVFDYFNNLLSNIDEKGEKYNLMKQIGVIEKYSKDKKLKKEMEDIIKNFDIGLNKFKIIEKNEKMSDGKERKSFSISGVHKTNEENKEIDFIYESSGTKSLFFMLPLILEALKNNGVVVIDEMETGLHPEAVEKIIDYFIGEGADKKVQLIFSSHSLDFLNKMDMHQIYLVEKNDNGESFAYRLNQVKPRSDGNFLAKYMSGAYGAFPKIRI